MLKEVIVLAVSYKRGGFCVAGIDASNGEWIRVVSNDIENERSVPLEAITFEDGTKVAPLDVMRIPFVEHCPTPVQPENWVYDETKEWELIRNSSLDEVLELHPLESDSYIFYNNNKSLHESEMVNGLPSLKLVKIENPHLTIQTFEKRKLRLSFIYANHSYNSISLTDYVLTKKYNELQDGIYKLGHEAVAVFSQIGRAHV